MTRQSTFRVAASGLALVAGLLAVAGPAARAQDEPRVIVITAKRFEFSPNQITLAKGETVKLQVKSEDVTHGLFVRPLGIDTEIVPGQVTELTVTPQQAGTYRAICDHFYGAGHGGMKMTIVVEEHPAGAAAGR
jgi:cytochrome c oxidase subunit II